LLKFVHGNLHAYLFIYFASSYLKIFKYSKQQDESQELAK